MMRESLVVLLLPALFLLLQAEIAEGGAFRSFRGGGTSYNNNQQYRANNYYKTGNVAGGTIEGAGRSPESEKQTSNNKGKGKEPGISAWGIIAVVLGVILLGTGGYYAFVFYPYLCKKQRSYDMIELTDVL